MEWGKCASPALSSLTLTTQRLSNKQHENYGSPFFRENIAEPQGCRKTRQINRHNESLGNILLGEEIVMILVIYLQVPVHE